MLYSLLGELKDLIALVHDPLSEGRGVLHVECSLPRNDAFTQQQPILVPEELIAVQLVTERVNFLQVLDRRLLETQGDIDGIHLAKVVNEVNLHPANRFDCGGEETVCAEDVGHVSFLG